ncbi:MAG TPA: DUF1697 domain-containing protein [Gemmatimonadaceae bacterium]|nr:DUF1697 domain-containing protein [Gemmatimonadaceae bacterium]
MPHPRRNVRQLVAFLRGANVGGHRTFRPSVLARELRDYDVVNVGAAGTFVVRAPGSRAGFRDALLRKLPFQAEVLLCDARDVLRLEEKPPFGDASADAAVVRFVTVLPTTARTRPALPLALPSEDEWLVRVVGSRGRFVFGEYRRHMKTIGYLGKLDALFGGRATTRNWNTIVAICRALRSDA